MKIETTIQTSTQTKPGMPVAAAMFAASECIVVVAEMKNTLSRSKTALSKH